MTEKEKQKSNENKDEMIKTNILNDLKIIKLYKPPVISNSSNTEMINKKPTDKIEPKFKVDDWIVFVKSEKFDPKTLKPFDKVLVRDSDIHMWKCNLFSHIIKNGSYPYQCSNVGYLFCIPYNDDTKHLVGTTEEAPEYYKYWED